MRLYAMLLDISMGLLTLATSSILHKHVRPLVVLFAYNLTLVLTLTPILALPLNSCHWHLKSGASGAIILVIVSLIVLISLQQFKVAKSIEISIVALSTLEPVKSYGQDLVVVACEVNFRSFLHSILLLRVMYVLLLQHSYRSSSTGTGNGLFSEPLVRDSLHTVLTTVKLFADLERRVIHDLRTRISHTVSQQRRIIHDLRIRISHSVL